MASPRSMFSGAIQLGLVNIPITIGKSWGDEREQSLIVICDHSAEAGQIIRIDRSEFCERCDGPPTNKRLAVQTGESEYKVLDDDQVADIEAATSSKILDVLDVQPLDKLPIMYSIGTYYIRHDSKSKMAPTALATLITSMAKNKVGLVVKWGNSTREKLCLLTVESGVLILRVIPFLDSIRVPSAKEREHFKVKVEKKNVAKMDELLDAIRNPNGFQYSEYRDEGLHLRQQAVERILKGEKPKRKAPPKVEPQIDIFEMIDNAVAEQRKEKANA
jgi:non-homologous end joining protein Ku